MQRQLPGFKYLRESRTDLREYRKKTKPVSLPRLPESPSAAPVQTLSLHNTIACIKGKTEQKKTNIKTAKYQEEVRRRDTKKKHDEKHKLKPGV